MSTVYTYSQSPHEVALCDCCDARPGTAMVIVCGIETWACDRCRGWDDEDPEESPAMLQQKADRARGLALQATEERQRLERMLTDAKEKERLACNAALKAEAAALGITLIAKE